MKRTVVFLITLIATATLVTPKPHSLLGSTLSGWKKQITGTLLPSAAVAINTSGKGNGLGAAIAIGGQSPQAVISTTGGTSIGGITSTGGVISTGGIISAGTGGTISAGDGDLSTVNPVIIANGDSISSGGVLSTISQILAGTGSQSTGGLLSIIGNAVGSTISQIPLIITGGAATSPTGSGTISTSPIFIGGGNGIIIGDGSLSTSTGLIDGSTGTIITGSPTLPEIIDGNGGVIVDGELSSGTVDLIDESGTLIGGNTDIIVDTGISTGTIDLSNESANDIILDGGLSSQTIGSIGGSGDIILDNTLSSGTTGSIDGSGSIILDGSSLSGSTIINEGSIGTLSGTRLLRRPIVLNNRSYILNRLPSRTVDLYGGKTRTIVRDGYIVPGQIINSASILHTSSRNNGFLGRETGLTANGLSSRILETPNTSGSYTVIEGPSGKIVHSQANTSPVKEIRTNTW